MSLPTADFFISYTGADRKWAEWIAWQLEQAGFKVLIQAWDFRPGNNFVIEMNRAATEASRTILVASKDALSSDFVSPEWATAFAKDPTGMDRKLIPVRVENFDIEGLLGPVVYVDLVGLEGEDATRALISGVGPGRSKPTVAPTFPGMDTTRLSESRAPREIKWIPTEGSLPCTRLADVDSNVSRGHLTVVEVHFLPVTSELIPVGELAESGNHLAEAGRAGGMFSGTSALEVLSTASHMAVRLRDRRDDDAGLMITRLGQRSAWLSLPRDNLGSVLDSRDLKARLTGAIRVLARVSLPLSERYVPIAVASPLMMLTVGESSVIGRRNSASLRAGGLMEIVTPQEDSVHGSTLDPLADEIAHELVARLTTRL